MRLIALAIAIAIGGCSGCAHLPAPVRDFSICLKDSLAPQVVAIVSDVEAALARGDYFAVLTDLAKRVGAAAVDCAVHEVMGRASAAPSPSSDAKFERGLAWLSR